jgi:hypothetical protein
MERACTPILVEALESVAAAGPRVAVVEGVPDKALRVLTAPLAVTMRATDRVKGFNAGKAVHRARRGARWATYESYDAVRRAGRLTYRRVLKKPSRRALKALRVIFSR